MHSYHPICDTVDLNQPKELEMHINRAPLYVHFCKKKHTQEGAWSLYISFQNHNTHTGTGKFIYNTSILDDK